MLAWLAWSIVNFAPIHFQRQISKAGIDECDVREDVAWGLVLLTYRTMLYVLTGFRYKMFDTSMFRTNVQCEYASWRNLNYSWQDKLYMELPFMCFLA